MRRKVLFVSTLLLLTTSFLFAQKKDFSYAQLFQNATMDVSKSLPTITKWVDDDHYLESRKDEADGMTKLMSVDVKTGKALPYDDKSVSGQGSSKAITFP